MRIQHLTLSTSLAALLLATPAMAELTPQDVWSDWRALITSGGQSVTVAEESNDGSTLTLGGVRLIADTPEADVSVLIDQIQFTALGDGRIGYSLSDEYPMAIEINAPDGPELAVLLMIRHPGLTSTASGVPGNITYSYEAPEISLDLDTLVVDGESIDASLSLKMADVSGTSTVLTELGVALPKIDSEIMSSLATFTMQAKEPGGDGGLAVEGSVKSLSSSSVGNGSGLGQTAGVSGLGLPPGFSSSSQVSYGENALSIAIADTNDRTLITALGESGYIESSVDNESMSYASGSSGLTLNVSGTSIPLPEVSAGLSAVESKLTLPTSPSEEPRDIGLGLRLEGVSVPEGLWAMVDPGGTLPRDPANLILSLSGKAKWLVDIMNPNFNTDDLTEAPGELHALTVDELKLDFAGASLNGAGAFTFDNEDTGFMGTGPTPEGAALVQVSGLSQLIDKLTRIGILPNEQAMMGRMMLGMFTEPADAPDTVQTRIEIHSDGAIEVNGTRVR